MSLELHINPREWSDTPRISKARAVLTNARSDIDSDDVKGARALIRRALAGERVNGTRVTATALTNGDVVTPDGKGNVVTLGTWTV